jgi:cell shape-determining protein MreC
MNQGLFVGKIINLKERIATVELLTSEQSRIAASRAGQEGLIGVVEGRGNRVARLTFVPQERDLETNALIVTAGTEEKIPPNLPIGLVNVVEGKPTDPFKTGIIEPFMNIDTLDLVLVLRPRVLRPDGT